MNYKEFYMEDEYVFFNKKKIILKFISCYYRYSTPSEIKGIVDCDDDIQILLSDTKEETDLELVFKYNRSIKNSGFILNINPNQSIEIQAANERGIRNGYREFCKHIRKTEKGIYIPKVSINHEPTLKLSGVIEGFYGRPWSHEDRLDCIKFIGDKSMNTYMYAPKDDTYHRDLWRELYPQNRILEFEEILNECKVNHIEFYYMIAPGKDFDFTLEADYIALKTKLTQLIELGVTNFGLLLDDIEYRIDNKTKLKFKTPAHTHSHIVNTIYSFLNENIDEFNLVMCPTEYDIDYDSPYLHILGEKLLPEIKIFWTGNETLSHKITKDSFDNISKILNHEIIIWDNVPVNDFETDRELIFIAPYENRFVHLCNENLEGIVLNPMDIWEMSKFTLASFSQYAYNAYNFRAKEDFKKAIEEVVDKEFVEDMYIISKYFRNSRVSNSLPFELYSMLNEIDIESIDKELNMLFKSVDNIKNIKSKRFIDSINPWILRIEREKDLWSAFMNKETHKVEEILKNLEKDNNKTPSNLVVKVIKNIK
ncbi:MAG: protein O-GlcNAcase [Peptostreptococcaceae bacterium]